MVRSYLRKLLAKVSLRNYDDIAYFRGFASVGLSGMVSLLDVSSPSLLTATVDIVGTGDDLSWRDIAAHFHGGVYGTLAVLLMEVRYVQSEGAEVKMEATRLGCNKSPREEVATTSTS